MYDIDIHFGTAVFVALAQMCLGIAWYSPVLFGKSWMKLSGAGPSWRPAGAGKAYAFSFVGSLITAFVLQLLIANIPDATWFGGVQIGFWLWLGFVATTSATEYLYAVHPKSWGLYFLHNGYQLLSLLLMGALTALWI